MRWSQFRARFFYAGMLVTLLLSVGACSTAPVPTTTEAYKKVVEDRLGPLWYHSANYYNSLTTVGTVAAQFDVPATGGKARNIRIVSNTGNAMDEVIVRRSIQQLHAPPIPPGLMEPGRDYLTFEETFTLFEER